jgi:ankyrin repeat protein
LQVAHEIIGKFIDASVNDHIEARRLLNANPELRNANWMGGEHLMNFLAIENQISGVKFCLENGFDANQSGGEFGTTPLHFACKLNYLEVAELLLKFGADPNAVSGIDDTPIHCCIRAGNANMIDLLITNGADPYYETELGETVFDNWPNDAEKQSRLMDVLCKHNVNRNATEQE